MILTFYVPSLEGRDYVISIVYSLENSEKYQKNWEVPAR